VHQLEQQSVKQASELDARCHQVTELEQSVAELHKQNELASVVNRDAENQLGESRSHLETLQAELSEVRSKLTTTCSEHDRLARDLADAVSLLQAKDAEHTALLQQLTGTSGLSTSNRFHKIIKY